MLEKAIEDIGKSPTVISSREIAESAPPISHTDCTIVKVNGDYLDPRIKNTCSELEEYDDATNSRLDQILDEYGLIVCGWSAEWDIALRRALERCKNHRYSTYWTDIREPKEKAKRLITLRCASFISIDSADTFFHDLAERVIAIESYRRPHPISKQVAVARTKNYLVSDVHRIELYDLLRQETEKVFNGLSNVCAQNVKILCNADLDRRLHQFEYLSEIVLSMIITGCFWGSENHNALWVNSIERIANISVENGQDSWLRQYPALLLFYGGGIASLANENYDTFAKLLMKPIIVDGIEELPPVSALIPEKVISENEQKNIFCIYNFNKWTALSNYLYEFLREPMKEFLHDDNRYQKCFDQFEYLVALQHAYLRKKLGQNAYGPIGRFGWKYRNSDYYNFVDNITIGGMRANKGWRIFNVGLFDGEFRNFIEIKKEFDNSVEKRTFGWINKK